MSVQLSTTLCFKWAFVNGVVGVGGGVCDVWMIAVLLNFNSNKKRRRFEVREGG